VRPLAHARRAPVSVQDDWGITLTARTVASAPNELVLVTLGVETGREREQSAQERDFMTISSSDPAKGVSPAAESCAVEM